MDLKICMATPWSVRCGIFSYSRDLTKALAANNVETYVMRLPRFGVRPQELYVNVAEKFPLDRVNMVHVQHEYGILMNHEIPFYQTLSGYQVPIVTTMHAVGNMASDVVVSKHSKTVIVHNKSCQKQLKRLGIKSVVIPHGVKTVKPHMTVEDAKEKVGVYPPASPVVGYLGFITQYKGLEDLVLAMTQVKEAALLIGGGYHTEQETQYMAQLKGMTLTLLPGRCKWLDYVEDKNLNMVYRSYDVVVYPSVWMTESGAMLMALGHGKAVLARRLAATVEKEKQGALMTFRNRRDLAKKLRLLLKNEKLRVELEEGARKYAEEHSWEVVSKLHSELYRSLNV